jgi:tetratricopeptide (TPR) repeat protein
MRGEFWYSYISNIIHIMKPTYLLLLLTSLSGVIRAQSNANDLVVKGATIFQEKKYNEALDYFEKAMPLIPNDTTVYLYASFTAMQLQRNSVAATYMEKYISNGGRDASNYTLLAQLYRLEKSNDKALAVLYRGISHLPSSAVEFKKERVNVLLDMGKTDEAVVGLKELTKLDPTNAQNPLNLGILYDNLANSSETTQTQKTFYRSLSVENYNKALQIDPANYDALFNLGTWYFNDAVALKKEVDSMDMKTYNANGKAVEAQVYGLFLASKPYFDRAARIKQEDALTSARSSLSSVLEQFEQKGIKPVPPSNSPQSAPAYTQKTSPPAYSPPTQSSPATYSQPTTSVGQNRVALVIGNSAYSHGSQLNNLPINDAQDITARLRELGFNVTTVTNGTKSKLEDALRQFSKGSTSADVALFFYAGHGIEAEGVNYLVPVDARLDDPADARFESVSLNVILDEMRRFKTKINLVYLDACRNNPFRSWSRDTGNRGFAQVGRLAQSTKVYYATQPGDVAQNGAGRNGMFTTALLRHLKKGVEIEDLMRQVTNEVNKSTNGSQLPYAAGTLLERFEF